MKREFVTEAFTIAGVLTVASAFVLLVVGAFYIPNFPDLAFLIPFFAGTGLFFVGMYREAKYSETYDIPEFRHNRRFQMKAAVIGGVLCAVITVISVVHYI
jgi:hypothetical protein